METIKDLPLKILAQRQKDSQAAVCLLHGYGADAQDLAGLVPYLRIHQPVDWYFAEGPLSVPIGPMMTGRAWFPIDIQELETALQNGEHRKMREKQPEGLEEAYQLLRTTLENISAPYKKFVLGGFSQGAMLSCEATLRQELRVDALIQLSGTLLSEKIWTERAQTMKLPFFQSHGRQDPLLNFQEAEALYQILDEAGWPNSGLKAFNGGHEIPLEVMEGLKNFLEQQL